MLSDWKLPIGILELLYTVLSSPSFLLWVYNTLYQRLLWISWYTIRTYTPKPDKPDNISRMALEPFELAGHNLGGLEDDYWSFGEEVNFQYFQFRKWFNSHIKPLFVQHRATEGVSPQIHPEDLDTAPRLSPPIERPASHSSRNSTASPDPADLFIPAQLSPHSSSPPFTYFNPGAEPTEPVDLSHVFSHPQPLSRSNTLVTPLHQSPATTPPRSPRVRPSLIHRDSETVTMQLELVETLRQHTVIEDGAEPSAPIADHGEASQLAPGPSWPSSDPSLTATAAAAAATTAAADSEIPETTSTNLGRVIRSETAPTNRSDLPPTHDGPILPANNNLPHHRVTALSNYASESFASHAACWLTTAALLPLEALFVRSLARSFLHNNTHNHNQPGMQMRLLRPLFSFSLLGGGLGREGGGGGGSGGWRVYCGNLLLLAGMQALVSSALWAAGTAVAVGLGRRRYGWAVQRRPGGRERRV